MKPLKKDRITFITSIILGTILLAGVILSIDFLYAGIQERLFSNINPDYEPNLPLANKVIIASSISGFLALVCFILIMWLISRTKRIERQLEEERTIDRDGSIDFRAFHVEISRSMKVLRDLFGYLVIIVGFSGLFSFLRFIWVFGKYRAVSQLFIEYYLANTSSILVSITLYLALGFMMTYLVATSLKKYTRLKIISKNYEKAMEKVLDNFDKLMSEEKSES